MKNILWSRKVTESHSTKALLPFGQFFVCNKQTFYFNSWALIVTQDGPERKELCFRLASFRSSLRQWCGPSISQRTSIHAQNSWWDKAEEGQGPRASGQRHAHSQKSHSVCNIGRWVGEVGSNTVTRYREVSDSWHLVMIAAKNRTPDQCWGQVRATWLMEHWNGALAFGGSHCSIYMALPLYLRWSRGWGTSFISTHFLFIFV